MLRQYLPRWVYIMCLAAAVVGMGFRFGADVSFFTLFACLWFEPRKD